MKKISFISFVLFLTGCATLSPEECRTANWYQIGEQDGQSGYSDRISKHDKACSKVNIIPNTALYRSGYKHGLKSYCQPEIIYDHALNGSGGYQVCPSETHSQLRPYYNVASRYYDTKTKREKFYKELDKYQGYLLDNKLSAEKRDQYISKIKDLKNQQFRIDQDFRYAEEDRYRFERRNRF